MAKVVAQETFDEIVKENIVEFSMSCEEAKKETIDQLLAQGINLMNIITDLDINDETGAPFLNEAIDKLQSHCKKESVLEAADVLSNLKIVEDQCLKSVPHRIRAAGLKTADVIDSLVQAEFSAEKVNIDVLKAALSTNAALLDSQPDIFDPPTLVYLIKIMDTYEQVDLIVGAMKCLQKACVLHEINRQNIMNANIVKQLKPFLQRDEPDVVKELCIVLRSLILDDDIRVEFGKAHEHARMLAADFLVELANLLKKFKSHKDVTCELLLTIASLTVRNEFCVTVEEAGALSFIIDAMKEHPESARLAREALKLVRALAGNDTVKISVIQHGFAPLISEALNRHKNDQVLAKIGLLCVSTLTLRNKENSKALFDAGIPEIVVEIMKMYPKNKILVRNGAWAIRNMVSRSREQCDNFIEHGAEEMLNNAMKDHPTISQDIKAALRDLECKVDLKEEWTGTSTIKIQN